MNLLLNAADAMAGDDTAQGGAINVRTAAVAVPPRGHETIRAATCPKGCDLLDKSVRLVGAPSIRVLCRAGDREIVFNLDPMYGRVNHRTTEPCDEGVIAAHLCPSCRTKLEAAGASLRRLRGACFRGAGAGAGPGGVVLPEGLPAHAVGCDGRPRTASVCSDPG